MPGPQRIVCLTEEPTEVLYAIGEQDRIVGISGFTVRPPRARREKPNDKSGIDWEFLIDNRSSNKYEVHLSVEVLDKSGQVIASNDRSPGVSAHSADHVKVSTRMRTVEAADAPKVRLRAEVVAK